MHKQEKKIYNIERDNINILEHDYSEQYRKMLVIEKVSQKFLTEQIKDNFHNKLLVKEVRREIVESNNLISILKKLIKGMDNQTLDLKDIDKLLNKVERSFAKREKIKSSRTFDINFPKEQGKH